MRLPILLRCENIKLLRAFAIIFLVILLYEGFRENLFNEYCAECSSRYFMSLRKNHNNASFATYLRIGRPNLRASAFQPREIFRRRNAGPYAIRHRTCAGRRSARELLCIPYSIYCTPPRLFYFLHTTGGCESSEMKKIKINVFVQNSVRVYLCT